MMRRTGRTPYIGDNEPITVAVPLRAINRKDLTATASVLVILSHKVDK